MAKTHLRLHTDLSILRNGSLDEIATMLAGYQNLPMVTDKYGTTVKQHLLLRSDVDVLPLLDQVGLGLTSGDLDAALRIPGPQVLVRLKAFHAMGVNLAQPIDRGDTVLHRLVRDFGPDTPAALEFVLGTGVPATQRTEEGDTLLHLLVGKMHDHQISRLSHLFVTPEASAFAEAMGLAGLIPMLNDAQKEEQSLRALQEAWVERFVAAGISPFDTNRAGLSVFDVIPRLPGGFERLFERRDAGFPARTEAQRRQAEHSPENIRLIERLEALAGRPYVSTRKENFLENLEVEVRQPDGSFRTFRGK